MSARIRATPLVLLVALALVAGRLLWLALDPERPFLVSKGGAQWIQADAPYFLGARGRETAIAYFSRRFELAAEAGPVPLTVRAMRDATVYLDGRPALPFSRTFSAWKKGRTLSLPRISAGEHTLAAAVVNSNGPALLQASCPALGLVTDETWMAAQNGSKWSPALAADASRPPEISLRFGGPGPALARLALPLALLLSASACYLYFARSRVPPVLDPSGLRWLLLAAWAALALNNIAKIPQHVGPDAGDHLDYIRFVASRWRIPFYFDGMEMHQAPLYYVVSAILYAALGACGLAASAPTLLRLIPLACGAAQVEVGYRAGRAAFPGSRAPQMLATALGGLMPMNIYLSQTVGNDPPFALLSALVLLAAMRLSEPRALPASRLPFLGALLGLALLTKALGFLLIPIVALPLYRGADSWREAASRSLRVFGVAFLVSAAFYLRNYLALGSIYVGPWDPSSHMVVWQSPGYWTWSQFLGFGRSLARPVFASTAGYWDALYSTFWLDGTLSSRYDAPPPWRYDFMLAGAWLALLPAAAVLWGMRLAASGKSRSTQAFCCQALAIFLAEWFLLFYLRYPLYGNGRYLLGALPCVAVLGAAGLEGAMKRRLAGALLGAWMTCWGACAYLAYWV